MPIRHVHPNDIPYLQQRMKELGSEFIDLHTTPAWVATDHSGNIIGVLPARLVWNLEPLLIFPEVKNKITASRAAVGLFKAAEAWLSDPKKNVTGITWYFVKTRSEAVKGWAKRLGWFEQWVGATSYIKHLK
ncbi:MAG: hypothetical protein JWQ49_124 [Edaphobacter sp.]|nr:hypothetical protein [Edaphobacter sp.]